ncbi:MAG: hypothetical protein Q4C60_01525, partial [Eubacteriales bacterium]|nr:hypothetical protein [Eubacteriales bacterium]
AVERVICAESISAVERVICAESVFVVGESGLRREHSARAAVVYYDKEIRKCGGLRRNIKGERYDCDIKKMGKQRGN